jgi:2-polyprenyl-3-methyl-5-hydroxy-6-metoxy-1,4-benzoquinol methylase
MVRAILACCYWRHIEPSTEASINGAVASGKYLFAKFGDDALIDRSRSRAATYFVREVPPELADVFIFIDSDMVFTVEDLDKVCALAREKKGIAVGAYPIRRGKDPWLAVRGAEGQEVTFGAKAEPCQIVYGSTGFMAIHRDVFLGVIKTCKDVPWCTGNAGGSAVWPFFLPSIVQHPGGNYEYLSEDWAFCERAREAGFEVWLDGSIDVGHLGSYEYHLRDVITAQSSREDQLAVVDDLAAYWHLDSMEVYCLLKEDQMNPVWERLAQEWRDRNPQTPAEAERYYKQLGKDHVLDLAQLNTQLWYWDWVAPALRVQGSVVDFGGGIGSLALALARRGCDVTYIDLRSAQREFAEWRFKKYGAWDIKVLNSLTEVREADVIVSAATMEHIHPDELPKVARQMFEALKPGGIVWTITDFGRGREGLLPMHYDTAAEFVTAMQNAGFEAGPTQWTKPYPEVV